MKTTFLSFILLLSSFCLAQKFSVIKNVHVWDGTSDALKYNQTVVVKDNLISDVGTNISLPPDAIIIDGKGGTLIPGLSDAHVHLAFTLSSTELRNNVHYMYNSIRAAKAAENFLMMGFTSARDLGGPVFGLKQAIDEKLIAGPRIFPSGAFISQTSGHGDMRNPNEVNPHWSHGAMHPQEVQGWFFLADGETEVLKASRENLKNGATQLKVMVGGGVSSEFDPIHTLQYTESEIAAAVKAANDWGTYVAVHVYTPQGIIRALNAGVTCIDHGQLIDDAAMKLLKEKNAWLVPQSYWSFQSEGEIEKMPPKNARKMREVKAGAVEEMELAKKYKVNLAFGTDYAGSVTEDTSILAEFTSRVRWFKPVEVLKQATSENARLFKLSGKLHPYQEGELGVVQKGAYADILIYDGNPLNDINVIVDYRKNLKFIMKDGQVIKNQL